MQPAGHIQAGYVPGLQYTIYCPVRSSFPWRIYFMTAMLKIKIDVCPGKAIVEVPEDLSLYNTKQLETLAVTSLIVRLRLLLLGIPPDHQLDLCGSKGPGAPGVHIRPKLLFPPYI